MKKFFLTLVVFSVLFIIGCGESSITDPLESKGAAEVQKSDDPLVNQGTIVLEGMIVDPSVPFNSYLQIRGGIEYVHELILVDPIPPAPQYYVSLNLSVNAELSDPYSPQDPIWPITDESTDAIYVSGDGIYLLDKTFPLRDRSDGMVLVCRFLVTTDGVGLSEMWLAVPEGTFNKINELDPFTMPPVQNFIIRD
jgi:hypothetical protein